MPRGDRTGPMGKGPMTGRAAGYCAGFGMPGYANPASGRGFGMDFGGGRGLGGGGRGWRHWFYATDLPGWQRATLDYSPSAPGLTKEQELQSLKAQADYFQNALDEIQKRLEELESQEESKK